MKQYSRSPPGRGKPTSIRLPRATGLHVVALAALCVTAATRAETPPADLAASAGRIEADVRFLADDLLEGREAGTRGYDLAGTVTLASRAKLERVISRSTQPFRESRWSPT